MEIDSEKESLSQFLDVIYGASSGYAYLALKANSRKLDWKQQFYKWPEEKDKFIDRIISGRARSEVYYGPALYRDKANAGVKAGFHESSVLWVDFDGNSPELDLVSPKPSIRVRSSISGREHWYWRISRPISDLSVLERYNCNLAYNFEADNSGWDGTQVLRPPFTHNHKRGASVEIISFEDSVYDLEEFTFKVERTPPSQLEAFELGTIPPVAEVLSKIQLKAHTWSLYKKGPTRSGKRSEALMSLGYYLAELQLKNEDILSLLLDADNRWGKFAGRTDQLLRLTEILVLARVKFPQDTDATGKEKNYSRLSPLGFHSLLKSETEKLEWIWEGFLQKAGYLLLTGAPKIGKTQFSLDFATRAVLGKDFLERKTKPGLKLGFLSLEMRQAELQSFMLQQAEDLTEEELQILEENFLIFPIGEPYYLSKAREQDELEEMIFEHKLDGLIIDSLGSIVEGELTSEKDAKAIMDWNDKVRNRHDCFTWFIHHHRKATGDNKKPKGLADIYGSYIFTARVTSALTLWNGGMVNSIELIPNAVRLTETPAPFHVYRDGNLHFTTTKSGITVVKHHGKKGEPPVAEVQKLEEDYEFTKGKFNF